MRRCMCLATLTLLCVFLTVATYEARQPRPEIVEVREVAANLYVLLNDPESRNMQIGGNTAVFRDDHWCRARRHEAGGLRAGYSRPGS